MAIYPLSLNPLKTEFLFIGLTKQLSKVCIPAIHVCSLETSVSTVPTAHNLGFIFHSNMAMSKSWVKKLGREA